MFTGPMQSEGLLDITGNSSVDFGGIRIHRISGGGMKSARGSRVKVGGRLMMKGPLRTEGEVELTEDPK